MLTDNPDAPIILIVEDDNSHVELIQRSFGRAPEEYQLEIAGTLLDAWKIIEKHPPSLVLTNYQLPDGDGNELVVMVNDACPVIIMTAQGSEKAAVLDMKIGAQDYIVKSPETFVNLPLNTSYALRTWTLVMSRKQASDEALWAKQDWERTFDAVPDLISIIDLNHTFTRVNKTMAERCGVAPSELIGRKCCESVHGLENPATCCPVAEMMQDGARHNVEVHEKKLGGYFNVTVSPLFDDEGHITSFVHVMRDITPHKLAEESLRKSEERYCRLSNEQQIILKTSSVGICFIKDRIVLWANPAFELIFGYEPGTTQQMPTSGLYVDMESYELVGEKGYSSIGSGAVYSQDVLMKKKDSSLVWCNIAGQAVNPGINNDGSIWVFQDISERKRAEEERRTLEKQFQQTQKLESLGVLAGGIAHDFNNILTIILGHCYMVKDNINSGMSDKDHVQKIETAVNRAADLCRQMMAYAGQSPQVQTKVNLLLLVDEIVKMLQSAIKKNVTIELDLKRDVPEIFGDNAQLQQVVMNLIINAAEAIGDNNGILSVSLVKKTLLTEQLELDFFGNAITPGSYACLEVSDTGCGIDEPNQKRIFEPFYTTKFAGRGLGMSAVLGIVKTHDGALKIASNPGVGTTFKIYFPLPATTEIVESAQTAAFVPAEKSFGTVLLVDDEEALRIIGSALLETMGFSTMTAGNGREALEIFRQKRNSIDLILLDMIMPEMGGIETYHLLREISPTIPVAICSGYSVNDIGEDIADDQNVAVIQKPNNPDKLRNTLINLLDKRGEISQ